MNFSSLRIVSLVALGLWGVPAHAADRLLPSGGTDQVPARLAVVAAPTGNIEREPVRFSWAIDPQAALADPAPFVVESREYWQTVDGEQLQRGVGISTTAPGALIRVSPVHGAASVDPASLRVLSAGRAVALNQRTTGAQLQAAGMPVGRGSAAVQLDRSAAVGRFSLQAPQARGRYVVHVFEPQSSVRMFVALARDRVLAGGGSTVVVNLQDGKRRLRGLQAGGLLVSPSGRSWPLDLKPGADGMLRAQVPVPADADSAEGLWEVQVFAGDGTVQRDARTALAVAQPTARLAGDYSFDAARLSFDLPLEVGSPGRYEARGTLYATGPGRILQPVAVAHSAQWATPGKAELQLVFDPARLPPGFGAPFELRELELNDQSRLAPIERRERAARVR